MRSAPPRALLVLLFVLTVAAACGENVVTQVIPVAQPLPEREEARYRILDDKGASIGSAVLTIAPEGDGLRLGLAYDFGAQHTDTGSVVVRRESMKPQRLERVVVDGERRYALSTQYSDTAVTATLDDGRRPRERTAKLSESAYDNLAAVFLWRTIDHGVGTELRYVNVVIDPRRATISRVLGTVQVIAREQVELPAGRVEAWRIEFRSAGVTNIAWYRADAGRELLRYEISRGPTLVLESLSP